MVFIILIAVLRQIAQTNHISKAETKIPWINPIVNINAPNMDATSISCDPQTSFCLRAKNHRRKCLLCWSFMARIHSQIKNTNNKNRMQYEYKSCLQFVHCFDGICLHIHLSYFRLFSNRIRYKRMIECAEEDWISEKRGYYRASIEYFIYVLQLPQNEEILKCRTTRRSDKMASL